MIAGPDFLWAIDGSQGPAPAKAFIAASKQATGKEFGRLLLTHHHGDHTGGLQFFPHAEVWSHPYCREEVLKRFPPRQKCGLRRRRASGHLRASQGRRAILTFKDDLTVFVGNIEVQFKYAGTCHTWGDMMAYLPKQKILFAVT